MKKFNLLKEIIIVDQNELLKAINSQKEFGITLDGNITYRPDEEILIYKGKHTPSISALKPQKPLTPQEMFGPNYKTAQSENKIGIKASNAWKEIVQLNYDKALYDDTSADGVFEFSDKDLEQIGWHADEFEVSYRDLIDFMEKECSGTLLCIEQEEPYHFSGMGFIDDPKESYEKLYEFARKKVQEKMKTDPLFAPDNLSEDEEEAARFFKLL